MVSKPPTKDSNDVQAACHYPTPSKRRPSYLPTRERCSSHLHTKLQSAEGNESNPPTGDPNVVEQYMAEWCLFNRPTTHEEIQSRSYYIMWI